MKTLLSMVRLFSAVCLCVAFSSCSPKEESLSSLEGDDFSAQRKKNELLSYTHSILIETTAENIENQYNATIKTCSEASEFKCIILQTRLQTGDYIHGHIDLRVEPKGLQKIIDASTTEGQITSKSTSIEDLAQPIIDSEKRISMLETHLDRLLKLQARDDNDVDSLIKLSSELAKTQTELENAKGEKAHLLEKINLDMMSLNFTLGSNQAFTTPILQALSDFSSTFSKGVGEVIWAIAAFSSWFVVAVIVLVIVRLVWRFTSWSKAVGRRRKKVIPEGELREELT